MYRLLLSLHPCRGHGCRGLINCNVSIKLYTDFINLVYIITKHSTRHLYTLSLHLETSLFLSLIYWLLWCVDSFSRLAALQTCPLSPIVYWKCIFSLPPWLTSTMATMITPPHLLRSLLWCERFPLRIMYTHCLVEDMLGKLLPVSSHAS